MSLKNVQFSVATHIAAVLADKYGEYVTSNILAGSVRADVTFVRRSIAKLSKAGIVTATRGKHGACTLARPPQDITLLDIYRASEAPAAFAIHDYAIEASCPVSCNIKQVMNNVLADAQAHLEAGLAETTLAALVIALGCTPQTGLAAIAA